MFSDSKAAAACQTQTSHQIGLVGAVSYIIGVIGSGIFVTPSTIFRQTHSVGISLLIWLFAGVVSTFGALSYAELGTQIRSSGADFAYMLYVEWNALALAVVIIGSFINYPCMVSIQLQTFSQYLVQGLDVAGTQNVRVARKLVEILLLWLIIYINSFSLRKIVAKFNILSSLAKILVVGVILTIGSIHLFQGHVTNFENPFHLERPLQVKGLISAFFAALFTYDGWDVLNFGAEETMPLAVLIGMTIVGAIYLMANCAYFIVLDLSDFLESDAIAHNFATATMGRLSFLISFFVCVLMVGAVNSTIFSASRLLYTAAKKGYLPPFISVMNVENESPRGALAVHSILVVVMNFFGDVEELISYAVFAQWSQRSITILILFYLRFKSDRLNDDSNVVRVPLFVPGIFFAACSLLILFSLVQAFELAAITVFVFVCTMIVYYLFFWKQLLTQFSAPRMLNYYATVFVQFIFNGMPHLEKIDVHTRRKSGHVDEADKWK